MWIPFPGACWPRGTASASGPPYEGVLAFYPPGCASFYSSTKESLPRNFVNIFIFVLQIFFTYLFLFLQCWARVTAVKVLKSLLPRIPLKAIPIILTVTPLPLACYILELKCSPETTVYIQREIWCMEPYLPELTITSP